MIPRTIQNLLTRNDLLSYAVYTAFFALVFTTLGYTFAIGVFSILGISFIAMSSITAAAIVRLVILFTENTQQRVYTLEGLCNDALGATTIPELDKIQADLNLLKTDNDGELIRGKVRSVELSLRANLKIISPRS